MNVGEYGNKIRVNAKEDITLNTNTLILTSPRPVVKEIILTIAEGLIIGTNTLIIGSETFNPGEYVEYEFEDGDVFISGDWKARLYSQAPSGSFCKITDLPLFFTIDP